MSMCLLLALFFFFQAEDGIRDLVRSRGLGDVYKRQPFLQRGRAEGAVSIEDQAPAHRPVIAGPIALHVIEKPLTGVEGRVIPDPCLLYTSDAADERSSVDLGGRRIIKKKKRIK